MRNQEKGEKKEEGERRRGKIGERKDRGRGKRKEEICYSSHGTKKKHNMNENDRVTDTYNKNEIPCLGRCLQKHGNACV